MSKDHGKKCQVKILDRKKFDRMFLTDNFLQSARNCLHHISDRYFQQKMSNEMDTGAQKCKERGARGWGGGGGGNHCPTLRWTSIKAFHADHEKPKCLFIVPRTICGSVGATTDYLNDMSIEICLVLSCQPCHISMLLSFR